MFHTKIKLLTQKNYTQGFIISNFLSAQTHLKLRNSNFFQVFVQIFEMQIRRKIFPKDMDPVSTCFVVF